MSGRNDSVGRHSRLVPAGLLITHQFMGEWGRGSPSTHPHRVFRRDQRYSPIRLKGDLEDGGLACGTVIAFVKAIPSRRFECPLAPALVPAGHTTDRPRGHNTMVVLGPLASVVVKNHSIS
jgi:hypothetical protein